ncbi:MAG TPA: Fe-S cluster assembly protein SufD [Anaerolineae bacterium]|nr:Fe-S cluster assembly protein SufD [Anaerolineae bacterium]
MTKSSVKRKFTQKKLSEVAPEFPFTLEDVTNLSERLGEPAWLRERRLSAWQAHSQLPMPSMQDEAWRRSDIRKLPSDRLALKPAEDVSLDPNLLAPLGGEDCGGRLVLRPGLPSQSTGGTELSEHGVVFCDWATAVREHERLLREHLGSVVRESEAKFAALAAGLMQEGALIYVPPGVKLESPLHTIIWAPGSGGLVATRLMVIVDQNAELTLVHETGSPLQPQGEAVYAGMVELHVGEGAKLSFVELQHWGEHVWNFTHERARLESNARIEWVFGAVGSRFTKTYADLDLDGEGAEGRMAAFYITDGEQHLDHDTQQNHLKPHTTSDLLFKGALRNRSRSVWQGMIYVAPGAQQADGYQMNRNLILSDDARADSIPGLEILADDVRCTHGATVGRLEDEPIFYLMTRGLERETAERLMIDGFFTPILERIPLEDLRVRTKAMLHRKLNELTSHG